MDKSIILDLVFDGVCYGDNIRLLDNKEYLENHDAFYEKLNDLCKDLPEDEKDKVFDELFNAQCTMESLTADEYFKQGFKLGLILGAQNFLE